MPKYDNKPFLYLLDEAVLCHYVQRRGKEKGRKDNGSA